MTITKEMIKEEIKKHGIETIQMSITDLFGKMKNIELPVGQLDRIVDNQIMFDGSSIEGFTKIEESDMMMFPDLSTWKVLVSNRGDRIGMLTCDVKYPDGTPFSGDPRSILKKVIEEAKAAGFEAFVGPEPEFFLFKLDEKGEVTTERNDKAGYFDFAPFDKGEDCRRDIVKSLTRLGFEVEAAHHEVAVGQHEVDFKYENILKTADNIQLFKLAVKQVAAKHNLHASFMPKPLFGVNGSGMHCHISLFQNGKNAFYDATTDTQLSPLAEQFMAGVLTYARENAALTNPLVNSYKRLVNGYEAPVYVAWSRSNRTCTIRVPAARGNGTRIEVRNPDPSANPYLALAALLKAGLEGIKRNMAVPKERKENLYKMSEEERIAQGIETLTGSLSESLAEMKNSSFIQELLGNHAFTQYVAGKEEEWDEFRIQVHAWEFDRFNDI